MNKIDNNHFWTGIVFGGGRENREEGAKTGRRVPNRVGGALLKGAVLRAQQTCSGKGDFVHKVTAHADKMFH